MKRLIVFCLFLVGCIDRKDFVEERKSYRIDSVAYYPVGYPSVANLDPRWIAYTEFGQFTYHHAVKVGDSVTVIIMTPKRDTVIFDPVLEHSEIKVDHERNVGRK
jgi:hypothetical protein